MKSRNLGGCPVGMTRVREAGDRCPRFPSPGVHYLTERPWLAEAIMLLSLESPAPTLLCCACVANRDGATLRRAGRLPDYSLRHSNLREGGRQSGPSGLSSAGLRDARPPDARHG